MFTTPGKEPVSPNVFSLDGLAVRGNVDDNYLVIGSHVDQALQSKIVNHEYVDFA